MTNMEKANEMLKKNPELMAKVNAEVERLANAKEAATPEEAIVKAVKTVLDIDVVENELKTPTNGTQELNLDEMDKVAGGGNNDTFNGNKLEEMIKKYTPQLILLYDEYKSKSDQ